MPALHEGQVDAIVLWFKLRLDASTIFSTGPYDAPTHFKQSVVYVRQNLRARRGSTIQVRARYDRLYLSLDINVAAC